MGLIYVLNEYLTDNTLSSNHRLILVTGIVQGQHRYTGRYSVRYLAYPKNTSIGNVADTFFFPREEIEEKVYIGRKLWREWVRIPKRDLLLYLGMGNKTPLFYRILKGDYKREIA